MSPKQVAIDAAMIELDGTPNKARLGANAILGVSSGLRQSRCGLHRSASVPAMWAAPRRGFCRFR